MNPSKISEFSEEKHRFSWLRRSVSVNFFLDSSVSLVFVLLMVLSRLNLLIKKYILSLNVYKSNLIKLSVAI